MIPNIKSLLQIQAVWCLQGIAVYRHDVPQNSSFSFVSNKNFNVQRADVEWELALQREQTFQQNSSFRLNKTRAFQLHIVQILGPTR